MTVLFTNTGNILLLREKSIVADLDGLSVRSQSLHHLKIFARSRFSFLAAFRRLLLPFWKSEQSDYIELQMSFSSFFKYKIIFV